MTQLMTRLEAAPADPLLGLMLAARQDTRADKLDLGVGIYKDPEGNTPVMKAVLQAEEALVQEQTTKAYEGPRGNPVFNEHIEELLLGGRDERRVVFASPGGSGALFVALRTIKVMAPDARIWISKPCWPNHIAMAERLGFETLFYTYKSTPEGAADLALVESDLDAAKPGDVLLLQGACHNPTGTDFTDEAWVRLAELARERGLLPFIDVAYQGFGNGLDEDVVGIRRFLEAVPEAIVTYSCSKNFGLYRERVGALVFQAAHADAAERVASHAAIAVRTSFSMPPAHGPAIVAKILGDQALRGIWTQELTAMTDRLRTLRVGFTDALAAATGRNSFQSLARENGMFAILPISKQNVEQVRKEHGIYMPSSGRINIAGLKEDRLKEVAEKLGPYLSPAD